MAKLQVAHLDAISLGASRWSIALTDTEYYYYRDGRPQWETEAALFGKARARWEDHTKSGSVSARDTWWWHLAPQFIEREDYGEIHKVEAVFIDKERN